MIVPCYRYGRFLRECVESILAQYGVTVQVLIIDDVSPGDTAEVARDLAREDPGVTFLQHTNNRGHISTYNEGIEWASAEYLLILSADDYLLPGALNRAASLMDANHRVGFTFGKAVALDDGSRIRQPISVEGKADWRILEVQEFIEFSGSRNVVSTRTAVDFRNAWAAIAQNYPTVVIWRCGSALLHMPRLESSKVIRQSTVVMPAT